MTTKRVPSGTGSIVHTTREGCIAPDEHEPAALVDLLDDALALLAVLPLDAHLAALLGLELDVVGEPALELTGVGDELPGAVGIDGQDDFAADGWS